MKTQYILLLFALLLITCIASPEAIAQCQSAFSYEVIDPASETDNGSVVLTFDSGEQGSYRIRVYDMVHGKFVDERSLTLKIGEKVTFNGLPTSSYFIYAYYQGCADDKYSAIGGKFGIQVGNK